MFRYLSKHVLLMLLNMFQVLKIVLLSMLSFVKDQYAVAQLAVCPKCGAAKNTPCKDGGGFRRSNHIARCTKARKHRKWRAVLKSTGKASHNFYDSVDSVPDSVLVTPKPADPETEPPQAEEPQKLGPKDFLIVAVACPFCGSGVGKRCRKKEKNSQQIRQKAHMARLEKAHALDDWPLIARGKKDFSHINLEPLPDPSNHDKPYEELNNNALF